MSHKYVVVRSYNCPDCGGTFTIRHNPDDMTPPSSCHLCGVDVVKRRKKRTLKEVPNPNARLPLFGKVAPGVDQMYRQMESASEVRAEMAAEAAGVDKSAMSHLKMTNMADNLKIGESAPPAPVPATELRGQPYGNISFQQNGAQYAQSISSGPDARAGLAAMGKVTALHAQQGQKIVDAGCTGKFKG